MIIRSFLINLLFFCVASAVTYRYDLAVVGPLCFADGIGRQSIGIIDALHDQLRIKFIPTRFSSLITLQDLPASVMQSIKEQTVGTVAVALLEDLITCGKLQAYKRMPKCLIKLAYSMVESHEVRPEWVSILNAQFDAVLVPDPFLVAVYETAGVRIPIFVLPLGMYIDDLLVLPQKQKSVPFVFGFSGSFTARKNHIALLDAFAQAFGNDPAFKLRLHGRADYGTFGLLEQRIAQQGLANVELINECWSWQEYIAFLQSLDCYVSLSTGEGYSLTPREALALGIPCILSDNTAHTTIIQTRFVAGLTNQHDAVHSLKDVVEYHDDWLKKARAGRAWVAGFTYDNLRSLYLSIIKPGQVLMGNQNLLMPGCLVTNSAELYKKYQYLIM